MPVSIGRPKSIAAAQQAVREQRHTSPLYRGTPDRVRTVLSTRIRLLGRRGPIGGWFVDPHRCEWKRKTDQIPTGLDV
jgi:hypothetical protein